MLITSNPTAAPPHVVLDTNVVLDWLVFRNPGCLPLAAAIEQGHLRWLVSEGLRDELAHVLGRGVVKAWAPDEAQLWATWQRLSNSVLAPTSSLPSLRCTDPDDQKFIDLAQAHAQWLLSRDRAVLKLARRAAPLGLTVTTPERWAQQFSAR